MAKNKPTRAFDQLLIGYHVGAFVDFMFNLTLLCMYFVSISNIQTKLYFAELDRVIWFVII